MTQAPDRKPFPTHRRSARSARNKPVLVASTSAEDNERVVDDASTIDNASTIVEESSPQEQPATPLAAPTKAKASSLKLPKFFSTVGNSEQTQGEQENTVARARLARATRGKLSSAPASAADDAKPQVRKADTKPAAPARPARSSAFKTRYLIGMGLYLIGANFIGIFVTNIFTSQHIDSILARFSLFGGTMVIRTSTLVYLAALVALLVLLARLDMIPRSFSAMSGQSSTARGGRSDSTNTKANPAPSMKQGVKGANDDLYQQYRASQRRERKK